MKKLIGFCVLVFAFSACNNKSESSETDEMATEDQAMAYTFDKSNSKLTWTAFKTPEKVGVSGSFDEIMQDGNSFTINTKSVNSGNPERDAKLKSFFFGNLSDSLITGSYGAITDNKMPITLKMNGIEKTFDFAVAENDTATIISGSIDIISDFSGNKALEGIHEACKELHMGKTWSDVSLQVLRSK